IMISFDHVEGGNALRDANHQFNSGMGVFRYRVGRKGRVNKNDRRIGSGLLPGLQYRVKDWNPFVDASAFSRSDTTNHIRTISFGLQRMKGPFSARNALDNQPDVFVNQNAQKGSLHLEGQQG